MANSLAVTERARSRFDEGQVALIQRTVARECDAAELSMFLELAARYELDPFAKQVWAIKLDGRMQTVVSRDGLLAIANRHADFRGCQSFEIREHDHFAYELDDHGQVRVTHRWQDANGNPAIRSEARGEMIGAFAYVRREGHVDTLFMAWRDQYDKQKHTWKSHPSAMMIKVAESMALRKAYSVSGVVGEGELEDQNLTAPAAQPAPDIDFGDDPELAEELKRVFRAHGYRRAKVRVLMAGCNTQEDRLTLLREQIELLEPPIPDAEVVDGEIAA